jgi:hypothetical protein
MSRTCGVAVRQSDAVIPIDSLTAQKRLVEADFDIALLESAVEEELLSRELQTSVVVVAVRVARSSAASLDQLPDSCENGHETVSNLEVMPAPMWPSTRAPCPDSNLPWSNRG